MIPHLSYLSLQRLRLLATMAQLALELLILGQESVDLADGVAGLPLSASRRFGQDGDLHAFRRLGCRRLGWCKRLRLQQAHVELELLALGCQLCLSHVRAQKLVPEPLNLARHLDVVAVLHDVENAKIASSGSGDADVASGRRKVVGVML
eukprot:scaffold1583_cov299-Pinguiococcus_pyrenoidosus.AAC.3